MIQKLYVLILIWTSAVFAQYNLDSVRPDVTFNADNDRFDITSMIQDTNRMFFGNEEGGLMEDEESRRSLMNNENQNGFLGLPAGKGLRKIARRSESDFAYHDRMESNEGGTAAEYEQNLKNFMNVDNLKNFVRNRRMINYVKHLHNGKKPARRSETSEKREFEKDLLMHYAVPFVMDVDGYLKVPLQ